MVLVLGFAGSVHANGFHFPQMPNHQGGVDVDNENTQVVTQASSYSNTGNNTQNVLGFSLLRRNRSVSSSQTINTGDAGSMSTAQSTVNSTLVNADCGCLNKNKINVDNSDTTVGTGATSAADTGNNSQMARKRSRQMTTTGNALSDSYAEAWVNMTQVSVGQ